MAKNSQKAPSKGILFRKLSGSIRERWLNRKRRYWSQRNRREWISFKWKKICTSKLSSWSRIFYRINTSKESRLKWTRNSEEITGINQPCLGITSKFPRIKKRRKLWILLHRKSRSKSKSFERKAQKSSVKC